MGVIIQQIAARRHGDYVYPNLAGVARSYDFYPVKGMKAEDGIASVALGLGRMVTWLPVAAPEGRFRDPTVVEHGVLDLWIAPKRPVQVPWRQLGSSPGTFDGLGEA